MTRRRSLIAAPERAPERVFLDANVLWSASRRADSRLRALWSMPGVAVVTNAYAVEEAQRNADGRDHARRLESLLSRTEVRESVSSSSLFVSIDLPEKDLPIMLGAIEAGADYLLTGDLRHFGRYMAEPVEGVTVMRPGSFIRSRDDT